VDQQLKRVVEKILEVGGVAFMTADHGNAELMHDVQNQGKHTYHTNNPIPAILTMKGVELHEGGLSDVAPTILDLMGIDKPQEMTGKSLISK
jgi:2,3-bisphosphoglycerate-independent phosphoglycerate mutase